MSPEKLQSLCIGPTATVRAAIESIDQGKCEIALVVDEGGRLLATVTDGDVRRGLLRGTGLDAAVLSVAGRNPTTAAMGTPVELLADVMAQRGIRHIPLLDKDGLVVDLALLTELATPTPLPHIAVVMAGGEGRRLRPLTNDVPKPMLPVGDRPLIETIIRRLLADGFRKIVVSTHYRGKQLEQYLGDGSLFRASIEYLAEPVGLGTIGGVRMLLDRVQHPLVVVNGDILTTLSFRALLAFHDAEGAAITVCVRRHPMAVPFGVVELQGERVIGLREKPSLDLFINAGMYVLERRAIEAIPNGIRCDATDLMEKLLAAGETVAAFPVREYWRDIGGPEDYHRAQQEYDTHFGGLSGGLG